MASLRVCIFMASFLTLPILCYHIEAFLKPALKSAESKILAPILLASPILAFTGLAFAYYFLLPPLLEFLFGFAKAIVEPYYGLEHYINLVLSIMVITALSFQLPVLIIAFAYFSIINSGQLLQAWRYVILGSFVVSALITPTPDPITMSILAAALLILYFVTYLVVRAMGK